MVDPRHDVPRVAEGLIEELLRSARNKGCTVVEAARPDDVAELDLWVRQGFAEASPLLERPLMAARVAARR
jgi:hypothetical protein